MKSIYKLSVAFLVAVTLIPATSSISNAKPSISQMKGEGFRKCKAQGNSGYSAVVRGTSLNSGSRTALFGKFSIRSCFDSKAECTRFANSIQHVVTGVNSIEYSACEPRG